MSVRTEQSLFIHNQYSFFTDSPDSNDEFVVGYHNSRPLNEKQIKILDTIHDEECCVKRAAAFAQDNPAIAGQAFVPNGKEIAAVVAVGGAGASSLAAKAVVTAATANPVAAGAIAGAGVTIWYAVITGKKLYEIQNTQFYKDWKTERDHVLKNRKLVAYIRNSELKHFMCKLSGKLPSIAVRIPNSPHIYDLEALKVWIANNPKKKFPHTGKVIEPEKLSSDLCHMLSIFDRLENLRQKTIRHLDQDAYKFCSYVNNFFGNIAGMRDINRIIIDYVDLSDRGMIDEFDNYLPLEERESHPILEGLFKLTEKCAFIEAIKKAKENKNTKVISALSKRKIVWINDLDVPASAYQPLSFSQDTKKYFSENPIAAALTITIPFAWIMMPPACLIDYHCDRKKIEKSKVLREIDLREPLDSRIVEYFRIRHSNRKVA